MQKKLFSILALSALMVGCATSTYEPLPTPETPPPDTGQLPPVELPPPAAVIPEPVKPAPVVVTPNPAVESLIRQARAQYQSQNYQGAIATAERGLRIDRRSADLYLVLAQSYVQLALPQKAKMFVQQGLRYAQQGSDAAYGLLRVQEIVGN
jgi:tetratricopeptide (TPR) repeat protein